MSDLEESLAATAWSVRANAKLIGDTAVGCAVLTHSGEIFAGCNIEHRYRSHDIHAETNAISSMVSAGRQDLASVFVAAERDRFTPCGSCMDWIFEFGGADCSVTWQRAPDAPMTTLLARELMPYYPR